MPEKFPNELTGKVEQMMDVLEDFLRSIRKEIHFYWEIDSYDDALGLYELHVDSSIWLYRQEYTWHALKNFFTQFEVTLIDGAEEKIIPKVANPGIPNFLDLGAEEDAEDILARDYQSTYQPEGVIVEKSALEAINVDKFKTELESCRRVFIEAIVADAAKEIAEALEENSSVFEELPKNLVVKAVLLALRREEVIGRYTSLVTTKRENANINAIE